MPVSKQLPPDALLPRLSKSFSAHIASTAQANNNKSPSKGTMSTTAGQPSSSTAVRPRSPAVAVVRPRSGSARASIGPGDTSDAGGKNGKPKKPRKKGWKGWAMQDLDEFGNVIEERLRNETPPKELTAEEKAIADAAFAAVVDAEEAERVRQENEHVLEQQQQDKGSSEFNNSREPSASRALHSDPPGGNAAPSPGSPSHQATSARLSTSGPKSILILPGHSESNRDSTSKATGSRHTAEDKDKAPAKKRRKTSLSTTPQPADSRPNSYAPRPAPANGKGKARASLPSMQGLTARQQNIEAKAAAAVLAKEAKEAREALSARGSPYVVEDDAPLPKVPRKGMGDDQAQPRESDLRGEAAFILESAEKHRRERLEREAGERQAARNDQPATPPPTGGGDDNGPLRIAPPKGDVDHSTFYQTPALTGSGDGFPASAVASGSGSGSGPSPRRQPEALSDEEFAAEFEAIQQHYTEQENHLMPQFADDPKPAKFHAGQKPTVVLVPQHGRLTGRIRDKHERAYLEGFDGLPDEFEVEISGFIHNVKSNMKTVVDFYFNHPTFRRDAFIERLGRELSIFGAQLTSDGEAALRPDRPAGQK